MPCSLPLSRQVPSLTVAIGTLFILQAGRATKNRRKATSELLCPLRTAHPEHGRLDMGSIESSWLNMALHCINVVFSDIWHFFCGKFYSLLNVKGTGCGITELSESQTAKSLLNANSVPADLSGVCGSPSREKFLGNVSPSSRSRCQDLCATRAESTPCLVQITLS